MDNVRIIKEIYLDGEVRRELVDVANTSRKAVEALLERYSSGYGDYEHIPKNSRCIQNGESCEKDRFIYEVLEDEKPVGVVVYDQCIFEPPENGILTSCIDYIAEIRFYGFDSKNKSYGELKSQLEKIASSEDSDEIRKLFLRDRTLKK